MACENYGPETFPTNSKRVRDFAAQIRSKKTVKRKRTLWDDPRVDFRRLG